MGRKMDQQEENIDAGDYSEVVLWSIGTNARTMRLDSRTGIC